MHFSVMHFCGKNQMETEKVQLAKGYEHQMQITAVRMASRLVDRAKLILRVLNGIEVQTAGPPWKNS